MTLGEEVRAWRFILDRQFDGIRDRLGGAMKAWFEKASDLSLLGEVREQGAVVYEKDDTLT